ncbi:MAG: transposase, partial [Opitutaceae bacterium]|nr:transposase [Opitutaceae bacterium]
MRTARIKVSPVEGEAVYHCMTRTVNGERLLDDPAKETLRKQLWQVADYCGVQILTYTILSNHFHVLVRVPPAAEISDVELLRRYHVMYPKPTLYQAARLDVIEAQLKTGGPEADAWRKRQLALMGDISQFMKLVKQRFSIWFNRSHHR